MTKFTEFPMASYNNECESVIQCLQICEKLCWNRCIMIVSIIQFQIGITLYPTKFLIHNVGGYESKNWIISSFVLVFVQALIFWKQMFPEEPFNLESVFILWKMEREITSQKFIPFCEQFFPFESFSFRGPNKCRIMVYKNFQIIFCLTFSGS